MQVFELIGVFSGVVLFALVMGIIFNAIFIDKRNK